MTKICSLKDALTIESVMYVMLHSPDRKKELRSEVKIKSRGPAGLSSEI